MSVYKKEVGYNGNERIRFCYSGHGKTLADTVRNLDTLSEKISTNFRPSADWNDNQAVAYNQVMQKIARLVKSPTADLKKQQES